MVAPYSSIGEDFSCSHPNALERVSGIQTPNYSAAGCMPAGIAALYCEAFRFASVGKTIGQKLRFLAGCQVRICTSRQRE
jgi:hypothetical protein